MSDLEFIKGYSKITVNKICKELGYDASSILRGKATKERLAIVRKHIEDRQARLYLLEETNNDKTNSTL